MADFEREIRMVPAYDKRAEGYGLIGSLFSGIGGLELGLEWAGLGPVRWQVESDAFCREVLATHWPDADRFDDVTTVDASGLAPVGVICGGFPCQDISQAGKGEGISGARSGLWREFARIVRVVRPRWVVVENVPALAHRGMGLVLGDLAASGYDAQWDCIPAAAVGAPHRRDRLFVVAWRVPDAERDGVRQRAERGAGSARSTDPRDPFPLDFRAAMADPCGERLQGRSRCGVDGGPLHTKHCADPDGPWPLPNVWIGVSAEDQQRADERIPWLLDTPAAVRFVSAEPLLGPIDFAPALGCHGYVSRSSLRVDQIIIGGESGPKSRPFDLAWARSIRDQCHQAGAACFVKQLGARPQATADPRGVGWTQTQELRLRDSKGGDWSEWPEDLRVREFPEVRHG